MTIAVFTFSLLGAMALGMPIAFALIVCGVALMSTIGMFDPQIVAQNIINGADSFPLMAIPFFMLAGGLMKKGGVGARIVQGALLALGAPLRRGALAFPPFLSPFLWPPSSPSGIFAAGSATLPSLHPAFWRPSQGRPRPTPPPWPHFWCR